MEKIEFGDRVKDRISKKGGIVVSVHYYINGCCRVGIQPEGNAGKPTYADTFMLDEADLEIVKKGAVKIERQYALAEVRKPEEEKKKSPAGPRPLLR
jgi:hypothetical protein